MEHHVRFSTWN